MSCSNKAFFLDRDGVLIDDVGYLNDIKKIKFLKHTFKALSLLTRKNFKLIIITNQSVVGRGLITENYLKKIHNNIKEKLKEKKIKISGIYYCPHHPKYGIGRYKKNCKCRKPNNLLIRKAIAEHKIDIKKSFFIGDKLSDKHCAIKSKINFSYRSKINFYLQIKRLINK
jgi:D,D-heptose 1,7-bisphosphate phosphatase